MAKAKIILFNSPSKQKKDGTFPISLVITHERKRKYFSLDRHCVPEQWNDEAGKFRRNFPEHNKQNDILEIKLREAKDIINDFERFDVPFTFDAFKDKFLKVEPDSNLKSYFEKLLKEFTEEERHSTASQYKTTLNAILEFANQAKKYSSKTLKLVDVDYIFLKDFEHWLRTKRDSRDTTISVYMRALRAAMKRAIREKILKPEHEPFNDYKISKLNTETPHRYIPYEKIKMIESLDLEEHTHIHTARNIFLFSLYTRGMNFKDIIYLTPSNIQNNYLTYRRVKTGKEFNLELLPQAKEILDFHIETNVFAGDFIFPIFDENIHVTPKQKYNRRKTALRQMNKCLGEIAEMVGLENIKLTSYVARHSYAMLLFDKGFNYTQIGATLGHRNESTTRVYVESMKNTALDEMNRNLFE